MTTPQFETSALAHRIALLDELGVGPLWLRRDALLDMAPSPSTTDAVDAIAPPVQAAKAKTAAVVVDVQSGDAAWDDGAHVVDAASAPLKTALTLCIKSTEGLAADDAAQAATQRYLFITRASSVQGAEELFDNILLALGMRKEAQTQGDLSGLPPQIAAHKPTILIVMEPAVAAQLIDGGQTAFEALRGRIHRIGKLPALCTYAVVHLLRNPVVKRKAWDDLCLLTTLQAADVVDPA